MSDDQELDKLLSDVAADAKPVESEATLPAPLPTNLLPQDQKAENVLKNFIEKFNNVANKVLDNYDSDRNQLEDTIKFLDDVVRSGSSNRVYVEMLVATLRTKTDANTNAVKLLDSIAKMVSASKNTSLTNEESAESVQDDLKDILNKPQYPDET